MADQNQQGRRGHFHRGRRGPDRRGQERRTPPPPQEHAGRDHVDVEQIMRDIRARIAQRHGIELTTQQIQDLAARRLEAILDPRAVKPALLDQLRRSAGTPPEQAAASGEPAYTFAEGAVFESHRGIVRLLRRLFKPLLMLFFNPTPVERALAAQSRLNVEAAQRDAERQRQQTEWNALHYEILQRLVTEVSRASLDLQSLSTRVESLAAKVDFNERRVRHIEGSVHQARPSGRHAESAPASPAAAPAREAVPVAEAVPAAEPAAETPQTGDVARRRRRRRRGRRGGGMPGAETSPQGPAVVVSAVTGEAVPVPDEEADEIGDTDDAGDETPQEPVPVATESVPLVQVHGQSTAPPAEPEPAPAPPPIAAHVPAAAPEPTPEPSSSLAPPAAYEPDRTE